MAGTAPTAPSNFWTRVRADLARDRRKTALMAVLMVVAAVLGVRMLGQHSTPAPAAAAVPTEPPTGGLLAAKAGAARADHVTPRKGNDPGQRENYLARMDRSINRDLFKTSPEYFPSTGAAEEDATVSAGRGSWLGDMIEQLAQQQQAQRDRLDQMAAIRFQAQSLNLQSTILGSTPIALINGQPLQAGATINGFVIAEITPNACRLTRDGVTVELRMKK